MTTAAPPPPDLVFYDGGCGLCHGAVQFALARDPDGSRFRYAPLHGETFASHLSPERRAGLPDSLVVLDGGAVLLRSEAVLHLLRRIGRGWGALAAVGSVVPRPLRDAAYDGVARIRHRLFSAPKESCPLVPRDLRARFLP